MSVELPYLILNNGKEHILDRCRRFEGRQFVIVSTKEHQTTGSNVVECLLVPSLADVTAVLGAAARAMNEWGLSGVIPVTESAVEVAGLIRSRYGLRGPTYEEATLFTNKLVMKRRFGRHVACEVPVPLGDFRRHPPVSGGMYVLKPIAGSGSRDIRRLGADEIVRSTPPSDSAYVVERALAVEQEYHLDVVVRQGKVIFAQLSKYLRPVLSAVGSYHGSVHLPDDHPVHGPASEMFHRILEASAVTDGVFHMEVLEAENSLFLGEIAMRPAGGGITTSLRAARGVDLWEEHFRAHLNLPPAHGGEVTRGQFDGCYGCCGLSLRLADWERAQVRVALGELPGVYEVEELGSASFTGNRPRSSVDFAFIIYFHLAVAQELAQLVGRVRNDFANLFIAS